MRNYRIYTRVKKIGDDYYEAAYKEYSPENELVSAGTEDFSSRRLATATKCYVVMVYNGRINSAGGRMTDCVGEKIRMSRNAVAIRVARMLYKNRDVARVERWG